MAGALVSEFLIALFAAIVVALTFRRNTPRSVELLAWGGLVWVCAMAFTGTPEAHARALTSAAVWGASQLVGTLVDFASQGVAQWISDHRFVIADWVVLLCGVDLLLLLIINSFRQGRGWQPRVKLRDWMELPASGSVRSTRESVDGIVELNKRFNRWASIAAASAITWMTLSVIWIVGVLVPSAARRLRTAVAGADGGTHRLSAVIALRDRARYALTEVRSAPQMDWLVGISTMPPHLDGGLDDDDKERDRRHRLAS
jgi:hypothetical protein